MNVVTQAASLLCANRCALNPTTKTRGTSRTCLSGKRDELKRQKWGSAVLNRIIRGNFRVIECVVETGWLFFLEEGSFFFDGFEPEKLEDCGAHILVQPHEQVLTLLLDNGPEVLLMIHATSNKRTHDVLDRKNPLHGFPRLLSPYESRHNERESSSWSRWKHEAAKDLFARGSRRAIHGISTSQDATKCCRGCRHIAAAPARLQASIRGSFLPHA